MNIHIATHVFIKMKTCVLIYLLNAIRKNAYHFWYFESLPQTYKAPSKIVCYLRSISLTFHEFLSIAQKLFAVPKKPINFSGNTFKAICVCFHYLFITIEGQYYLNFYQEDFYVNKLYLSGTLKSLYYRICVNTEITFLPMIQRMYITLMKIITHFNNKHLP